MASKSLQRVCGMPCLHMPTLPRTTWHGALGEVTEKFSPKIARISFDNFCHHCLAKSSGHSLKGRRAPRWWSATITWRGFWQLGRTCQKHLLEAPEFFCFTTKPMKPGKFWLSTAYDRTLTTTLQWLASRLTLRVLPSHIKSYKLHINYI